MNLCARTCAAPVSFLVLSAAVGSPAATDPVKVQSCWAGTGREIDGSHSDWPGRFTTLGQMGLDVAFANDDATLYVALATSDRSLQAAIVAAGLTVWFDTAAATHPQRGVRFPVCGFDPDVMRAVMRGTADDGGDLSGVVASRTRALELVGGDSGAGIRPVAQAVAMGVDAALQIDTGRMLYELRAPLSAHAAMPFAVGARRGMTVGVGLVSCPVESRAPAADAVDKRPPRGSGPGGGGPPPGRMGGGPSGPPGRGRGGGPPGGSSGDRPGRPSLPTVTVWVKVDLASADTTSHRR